MKLSFHHYFGTMSAFDDVYDCVVVGLGGHGSAAIASLAKDGQKVIGFEQFGRVHENGG
jgi:flavin-dependent dehydrogenase